MSALKVFIVNNFKGILFHQGLHAEGLHFQDFTPYLFVRVIQKL